MALNQEQKEILSGFGQQIVDQLKTDIKEKRVTKYGAVNASGDLQRSVRFTVDERSLKVFAEDYIYYLEHGRKPGKFPPIAPIKQWIEEKNLTFDIPIASLAFLIARKIARKGTTAWEQGGTDLVSDIVNTELIDEILSSLSDAFAKEITSDILDAYLIAA